MFRERESLISQTFEYWTKKLLEGRSEVSEIKVPKRKKKKKEAKLV